MSDAEAAVTKVVAQSFQHLHNKEIVDADVDMFQAVLNAPSIDALKDALVNKADPNVTDTAVLGRHERLLSDLVPSPWTTVRQKFTTATTNVSHRISRSSPFAYTPLSSFLMVAALGLWTAPTDVLGPVLVGILVCVPLVTIVVAWRARARFGEWALVGGGTSLAWFTAAYVAGHWSDDQSILRTGLVPIDLIAEAAFLSLTVGVTGGTIGLELNGIARVIAFLQILFTLSFAAILVTRAWRRLATTSQI